MDPIRVLWSMTGFLKIRKKLEKPQINDPSVIPRGHWNGGNGTTFPPYQKFQKQYRNQNDQNVIFASAVWEIIVWKIGNCFRKQRMQELEHQKLILAEATNAVGKMADTLIFNGIKLPFPKGCRGIDDSKRRGCRAFIALARQRKSNHHGRKIVEEMWITILMINYPTDCASLTLEMPIQRRLWLEAGYAMDKVGLKPKCYFREKTGLIRRTRSCKPWWNKTLHL